MKGKTANKQELKQAQAEAGSVVVYAVFLMMVLSATAMMTAFVIFINIKATASSVQAAVAYYAAESGLEASLGKIKRERDKQVEPLTDTLISLASLETDQNLSSSEATFSASTSNEETTNLVFDLNKYKTKEIGIFDPDDGSTLGVSNLNYAWTKDSGCADSGNIFITLSAFTVNDFLARLTNPSMEEGYDAVCCSDTKSLNSGYAYLVKIRSLDCDLEDVDVSITDSSDASLSFPNYLSVKSEGSYRDSTISLKADTIWRPSLSGLGQYVLFSEDQIIK